MNALFYLRILDLIEACGLQEICDLGYRKSVNCNLQDEKRNGIVKRILKNSGSYIRIE